MDLFRRQDSRFMESAYKQVTHPLFLFFIQPLFPNLIFLPFHQMLSFSLDIILIHLCIGQSTKERRSLQTSRANYQARNYIPTAPRRSSFQTGLTGYWII